jgi:two-component system NtrC family sensor kinase
VTTESADRPERTWLAWIAAPDLTSCRVATPAEVVAPDHAAIVERVHARRDDRPLPLLVLIGTWLTLVLMIQLALQPEVAWHAGPVAIVAIACCGVGIAMRWHGKLGARRAWQVVSLASCLQAVTLVFGFFLTGTPAYLAAVVLELLAVGVLDMRGRAIQLMTSVILVAWVVGTSVSELDADAIWNLMIVIGGCSVAVLAHVMTMHTTYGSEWLRVIDDRRADELATALEAAHQQLRARQRAERKLEKLVLELKAAQDQLVQAHKLEAIGQLAAGVAHEINTPTQFVSDNTTFLQGAFDKLLASSAVCRIAIESGTTADAELARQALERARLDYHAKQVPRAIEQSLDGLRRIASLVAALKEFSHPSGGVKAAVDLNQAIQTTITIARNEWKYVAELTTDFDPDLPPVWCLQDELNQVVLNMIVNAAHAIAEHAHDGQLGKIAIRTSTAGELAVIEISDNGAGIPETIRHRIFEPFFTTKPQGKGTGQGLAISYGVIVDKHQGSIDVDSAPGRGTRFTIKLPLSASALAA